jgi:hypothetical protein
MDIIDVRSSFLPTPSLPSHRSQKQNAFPFLLDQIASTQSQCNKNPFDPEDLQIEWPSKTATG